MGLVKTRRLAAMRKQQRAKVGMTAPTRKVATYPRQLAKHLQAKVSPPAP